MAIDLAILPAELVASILSHLSTSSLLSFSATSKTNQIIAQCMFRTLNLAVLPREIHGRLALANQHCRESSSYTDESQFSIVQATEIPLDPSRKGQNPTLVRRQQILAQNDIATQILRKNVVQNLKSLSLHMYEIQTTELTLTIARKLPELRSLELNLQHQYIHDSSVSSKYWREAPEGNPCWNALVGLGSENQRLLRLRKLRHIRIERAGLTSAQLRRLVESNPSLRSLQLINVTGVDHEFVEWLSQRCYSGLSTVENLQLESCSKLRLQKTEDFACLAGLCNSRTRHLSLRRCDNVKQSILEDVVEDVLDIGVLGLFVYPQGQKLRYGQPEDNATHVSSLSTKQIGVGIQLLLVAEGIAVDPEYLIHTVAAAA